MEVLPLCAVAILGQASQTLTDFSFSVQATEPLTPVEKGSLSKERGLNYQLGSLCGRLASPSQMQMGYGVLETVPQPHTSSATLFLLTYLLAVNGSYEPSFLRPSAQPVANHQPPGLPLSAFAKLLGLKGDLKAKCLSFRSSD